MALYTVMTQHLAQHSQGVPACIVAFTRIYSEGAFYVQVAERAPTRISREVVGVEGDQRIGRVMVDITKPAVLVALEHHHLIGPNSPVRQLLAQAFRNGAEIFTYHHATMRQTFLRGRGQQGFE